MTKDQKAKHEPAAPQARPMRRSSLALLWVSLLLILGLAVSAVFFHSFFSAKLFQERQTNLTELTLKISEVLDITVDSLQSKADSAQALMEQSDLSSEDDLFSVLKQLSDLTALEDGTLLAFDSEGTVYSADGFQGQLEQASDLLTDDPDPVIQPMTLTDETLTYLVFSRKLETPKPMGSSALTHVAVAVPLEQLRESFTISVFGDQCDTYLIDTQGQRLYHQRESLLFAEDDNLLDALSQDAFFRGGTAEELSQAVHQRQPCCMEFRHSGQDCFVAAAPLSHSQWTVLVFVPAQVMAANTLSMTRLTLAYFVLVGVIIAFVLTCLSLSLMLYRNNKRRMAQRSRDGRILSRATERVNSANAAKNQFISHMSHDVRTPINGIVGMTNIALKSLDQPARVENCLRKINSAANRLLTLMNDVQEMSRLESGKVEITTTPLELRTLLDNCCSTVNGQLIDRKVTLLREFESFDHPYLLGDALHTRQVLLNLLGSAAQYTPDGGTIRFRAQELWAENGTARFRFEWIDDGIGIRPEFLAHIFDPFAQEDGDDRAVYQGSGLGMAVSKQLVELMGGTIAVESQLNRGSRFTVELPFAINPEKTPPCANVSLEGLRVLVVEDNELNLEIAQELLSEEGVIVSTAENGQLGLDAFTSAPSGTFDVILMDVTMPVLDGYEATRAIRASDHPQATTIPIIAMTANAYAEDVAAAREAGMNDHVAKPIDLDRLLYILSQYSATRPTP